MGYVYELEMVQKYKNERRGKIRRRNRKKTKKKKVKEEEALIIIMPGIIFENILN